MGEKSKADVEINKNDCEPNRMASPKLETRGRQYIDLGVAGPSGKEWPKAVQLDDNWFLQVLEHFGVENVALSDKDEGVDCPCPKRKIPYIS